MLAFSDGLPLGLGAERLQGQEEVEEERQGRFGLGRLRLRAPSQLEVQYAQHQAEAMRETAEQQRVGLISAALQALASLRDNLESFDALKHSVLLAATPVPQRGVGGRRLGRGRCEIERINALGLEARCSIEPQFVFQ